MLGAETQGERIGGLRGLANFVTNGTDIEARTTLRPASRAAGLPTSVRMIPDPNGTRSETDSDPIRTGSSS